MSNFVEIHAAVLESLHAYRQADMARTVGAFVRLYVVRVEVFGAD
jgi:hypothetical protein